MECRARHAGASSIDGMEAARSMAATDAIFRYERTSMHDRHRRSRGATHAFERVDAAIASRIAASVPHPEFPRSREIIRMSLDRCRISTAATRCPIGREAGRGSTRADRWAPPDFYQQGVDDVCE